MVVVVEVAVVQLMVGRKIKHVIIGLRGRAVHIKLNETNLVS